VENRGLEALAAPPKRGLQMNTRGLFIGWQDTEVRSNVGSAFERTSYLWSNARHTFDRK
jgi:hypothetical protein